MTTPKMCFKCGETQPLSEFYRHARMADGHLGKCKRCTRRDVQENRQLKRDHYIAYDRERFGPESIARVNAYNARYPEKLKARKAVQNAVRRGKMRKQPCTICGEGKVDAHHADYSRRLDVRWLCRRHHGMAHRIENPF